MDPITPEVVETRRWMDSFQAFMAGPIKEESLDMTTVHTLSREHSVALMGGLALTDNGYSRTNAARAELSGQEPYRQSDLDGVGPDLVQRLEGSRNGHDIGSDKGESRRVWVSGRRGTDIQSLDVYERDQRPPNHGQGPEQILLVEATQDLEARQRGQESDGSKTYGNAEINQARCPDKGEAYIPRCAVLFTLLLYV